MLIGGRGGRHSPIFHGHAARELVIVYSVTFFISNSILLLLVVGQMVKTPPPLQRKVSRHITARRQLTSFGIAMQNNTPLSRTVQAETGPRFGVTELLRSIEMPMETDGCL